MRPDEAAVRWGVSDVPHAKGEGMQIRFVYGEDEFCEPKSHSWNTCSGTSWQWRQRAS